MLLTLVRYASKVSPSHKRFHSEFFLLLDTCPFSLRRVTVLSFLTISVKLAPREGNLCVPV